MFDYIEMFYDPTRKHTQNGMFSPVDFEISQQKLNEAGVWEIRGTAQFTLLLSTAWSYQHRLKSE